MADIAQGALKQLRIKRQTAKGTISGTSGGQILRRKTCSFIKKRDEINTADEIASHQQVISAKQGAQAVDGKLNNLLSPGTYSDLFSQIVRKDFVAGATTGALIVVTAAVTTGAFGTFTRSTGSYLTDGFKVGDVVRWTGWATTGVPNNAHNFLITVLTATVMSGKMLDNVAVGPKAAGDSVTCTVVGKKTYVPDTGHTKIYNTVEEWWPDATVSRVSTDVMCTQVAVKLPGSGNAEVDFTFFGLDQLPDASSAYFASPATETTTDVVSSATGMLVVNGSENVLVTNLEFTIDGQGSLLDPSVSTNVRADVQRKKVLVKGSFSAFMDGSTLHNLFHNETETTLISVLAAARAANADFIGFSMPRIKIMGDEPDDGEKAVVQTLQFMALYDFTGGAGTDSDKTTLSIQDSQA